MLQIKLRNITPANRFATRFKFFDNTWKANQKIATMCKINLKKIFKKHINTPVNIKYYNNIPNIILSHYYNKSPYNLVFLTKTIYNQEYFWPGISLLHPGKLCFLYTSGFFQITPRRIFGSCFSLQRIPYNFEICYISNLDNNKWTFIKSSGSSGIKLKTKKHIKLILVKLPSKLEVFFYKASQCFIGSNFNLFLNKQVEGKWGFSFKRTKKKSVRGVAKNPVDHPNGGRTKAKQPEKTPWGWIAKNSK
jgi:hypothetical protein